MEYLGQLGIVLSRAVLTPTQQMRHTGQSLRMRTPVAVVAAAVLCLGIPAIQAEQIQRNFPTSATPSFLLHNHIGSVSVKTWEQNEIEIRGESFSDVVEIMIEGGPGKVSVQIHPKREGIPPQQLRVEFQIRVPRQATVRLDCESGNLIVVEDLQGDVFIESVSGRVELSRIQGNIVVRTMDGPILIRDSAGHIEARSISGNLEFIGVNGSLLLGNTNSGTISYEGDFGFGGNYILNNHSALIRIQPSLQSSFDLKARAVEGVIESDLTFRPIPLATPFRRLSPRKFVQGRINSGESTVTITSFSGTIRLHRPR